MLLDRLKEKPKPKVDEIDYEFPDFKSTVDRVPELLTTTVVAAVIDVLKNDSELASWMRQGLVLHQNRGIEQCQFCEKPLSKDRVTALEAHFSDEYEKFVQHLDQRVKELQNLLAAIAKIQVPHKLTLDDEPGADFDSLEARLKIALASVKKWISTVVQALNDRKQRVFDQVELKIEPPQVDLGTVEQLNVVIRKHNQVCDDFGTRTRTARMHQTISWTAGILGSLQSTACRCRSKRSNDWMARSPDRSGRSSSIADRLRS